MALVGEDLGAMLVGLDALPPAPGALMPCDHGGTVQEPHLGVVGGGEGEGAQGVHGRHRVEVVVEVDEGGLVGRHGRDLLDAGHRRGQREEALALLGEEVGDGAVTMHGVQGDDWPSAPGT